MQSVFDLVIVDIRSKDTKTTIIIIKCDSLINMFAKSFRRAGVHDRLILRFH
jgi:hypothetical protein